MQEQLNRGRGALEQIEDIRNYDFEIVCGAASSDATYPKLYEIDAPKLMRCKDQGSVGACVAEVIAQVSEAYFSKEMSEGHVYAAFRTDGTSSYGMFVEHALNDWRSISTVPLQYFNHLIEMPQLQKDLKTIPELDTLYTQYKIQGFVSLNYADRKKKDKCIKEALMGPAKKYGLVAVSNKYFRESHCIWLTGWDDDNDAYLIKNSWGESWGSSKDGRGSIPKSAVNAVYMVMFEEPKLPFKDVVPTDWFYNNVLNMYCSGLMKGKSATEFDPQGNATRAEVAALADRILSYVHSLASVISGVVNIKTDDH